MATTTNTAPQNESIEKYLEIGKDCKFIIPLYQREYSWTENECDKLFEDINDYIQNYKEKNENYFFGTIIINILKENELNLLDGQQRTTTFLLLLKALLIKINEKIIDLSKTPGSENNSIINNLGDKRRRIMGIIYKMNKDDLDITPNENDVNIYQNVNIYENKSINENNKFLEELTKILSSKDFAEAEEKVYKIPKKQKDNKYSNYFRNFKFYYEKFKDLDSTEINDFCRIILDKCELITIKTASQDQAIAMFNSLNSKGSPLSDGNIISAELYGNCSEENKNKFEDLWTTFVEKCDQLASNNICDMNNIFNQYMYYNRALDKDFAVSRSTSTPGMRRYFIDLNKNLLKDPIKFCNDLINVANNWNIISNYPIIQTMLKLKNKSFMLFLGSYLFRFKNEEITKAKVLTISELLLRLFIILTAKRLNYSETRFKSFLFEENIKFVDDKIDVDDIKKDFIDNHIRKNWNYDDLVDSIKNYEGNELVYVNELLYSKLNNTFYEIDSNTTIEHIMPKDGKNKEAIRTDAGLSDDEFKNYVEKLGNKILLEKGINSSIGTEWFKSKVSMSKTEKGYKDSKYPIAKGLSEKYGNEQNPVWKKDNIDNATDKAANRIAKFVFES